MAYSQTKYHLVVIRFAIVCLTIGLFCFLTGVSLRSLDVLRNPSICFGGNNYEIRFSFVVPKEKLLVLKKLRRQNAMGNANAAPRGRNPRQVHLSLIHI